MRITTIQNILHTGYRNAPVIPSLFLAAARDAVPVPESTFDQDAAAVKFMPSSGGHIKPLQLDLACIHNATV